MEEPVGLSPATEAILTMPALPLGLHHRGDRLGQAHRPRQVGGHDPVPYFHRETVEIAERDREVVSGVVDQDIDAAEGLRYLADQPLHSRVVGDVTGESMRVDLILRLQFAGDAFSLLAALCVHDGDMRALLCERVADALSQPAVAARHQCNLTLQIHRFHPVMRMRRPCSGQVAVQFSLEHGNRNSESAGVLPGWVIERGSAKRTVSD